MFELMTTHKDTEGLPVDTLQPGLQEQMQELRGRLSTAVDDIGILKEQIATLTRRAPRTYVFAACAALNSCNLGFDIGVSSDVGLEVQDALNLSDVQTEFFMGSINLVTLPGSPALMPRRHCRFTFTLDVSTWL